MSNEDENEKFPFQITTASDLEVGQMYPVFGMITEFLNEETIDNVKFQWMVVNYNLKVRVLLGDEEKLNLLKERCFETGIFVTQILEVKTAGTYAYIGDCKTIVYGRRQNTAVN